MRKIILAAMTAWFALMSFSLQAQQRNDAPALKVGDTAPDFKLQYFDGTKLNEVALSQYHGKKNVALAFYVFAFTGG